MSVIIIPRKHLRMPQGRVRVPDEWIDTGLGAVILPRYGARNLVTGITGVGGRTQRAGQFGVAARNTVATDAADVGISAVGTRAFTWLTLSKFDSPGGTSWGGFAAAKRGTQYLWALMRQANQQPTLFYRLWTGSAHGSETSYTLPAFGSGGVESISGAQAGLIGFAFDANAGTGTNATVVRQYRDGVEQTNTTTISQAGTFDMSADGSFFRAGGNHDGPYGAPQYAPWPHDLWMTLYWPTVALASELAQDLQRAPYQILAADQIRIYSFPTGPISLAATGTATATGTAQLAASIALAGVGVALATGTGTLAGATSAALAATGAASATGAAAPRIDVALSALGFSIATGTATLDTGTTGSLAASGSAQATGTAAQVASVTIAAAGLAQAAATAGLSADILLAGAGAAQASGNATLAAQLAALAQGAAQASGTASITATSDGSLLATGAATASGGAALVLEVRLQAAGSATASGSGALSSGTQADLQAGGAAQASGAATLRAELVVTAAGFVQAMGAGHLRADVELAAFGGATASGTAVISSNLVIADMPMPAFVPSRRICVIPALRRLLRVPAAPRVIRIG